MIVEWLMKIGADLWNWFIHLFDGVDFPDAVKSPPPEVAEFLSRLHGFGVWIPFGRFGVIVLAGVAFVSGCFALRAARSAIGHLPWIGGNG